MTNAKIDNNIITVLECFTVLMYDPPKHMYMYNVKTHKGSDVESIHVPPTADAEHKEKLQCRLVIVGESAWKYHLNFLLQETGAWNQYLTKPGNCCGQRFLRHCKAAKNS